ncbi:MAG: 50S ribosomal protein L20 [Acholeplasmatales bacterium]|nr:50S ribosomal protein L20 [Acholeplasmatales bacterium]
MPRVKGGYTTRRRRKAVLKLAKGYYGSKHTIYKTAHEQVMRSLRYAFRDRKARKREFRKLWITRINAACQLNDIKYSRFINGLNNADVVINRKMLADMAVNDPEGFKKLVEVAKKAAPKAKNEEKVVVLTTASKAEKAAALAEEAKAQKKPAKKTAAKKEEDVAEVAKEEAPKKTAAKKTTTAKKATADKEAPKKAATKSTAAKSTTTKKTTTAKKTTKKDAE